MEIFLVFFFSLILASLPYLGFGAFIVDGMNISCTFDYVTTTSSNIGYVITITCFGFLGQFYCYSIKKIVRKIKLKKQCFKKNYIYFASIFSCL